MGRSRFAKAEAGMRVRKETAGKLLDGSNHFVIPYFQRAYVWDKENWDRFLEDIETIESKEYFMGFIVLKIENESLEKVYSVVDGQQRLTTFFLFARALCEIKDENWNIIDFDSSEDNEPILEHNHNDKTIFDLILKDAPIDKSIRKAFSENNNKVLECYDYFLGEEDRLKKINLENILEHLSFVCMYLTEEHDEQKIFDTMNSLGEPLRTGDLLKNELFSANSALSKDAEALYEETWKEVFEKDPSTKNYWDKVITTAKQKQTNLDVLLKAYLEIKAPDATTYKKHDSLFSRYKDFLKKDANKESFIHELMEYAREYREFINPEYLNKELDPNSLTQRLNIIIFGLNITPAIPYVLYVLKIVEDESEKREIFKVLESYLMRRIITGSSSMNYTNYFMRHIAYKKDSSEALKKVMYEKEVATDSDMPKDSLMKNGFENKKFINSTSRIILYFLEHHANPTESSTIPLSPNGFSVEHIMPKSWKKNWADNLPDIENAEEERNKAIFTLGNLTLITAKLNSRIRNAGWQEKKEGIASKGKKRGMEGLKQCCRGLATFSEYLEVDDWNEDRIKERGDELFELAKDLWKYKPPA